MTAPFAVPPGDGLDLLALGALVIRLDPGDVPFGRARSFDVHVSGAEYNVAANLADCFGLRTGIASAMVDYPIGALVEERVRAAGVTPFYRRFEHDGVAGPNIATVFSDRGHGVRPPLLFYNRANEAAGRLRPGDFDWPAIFGGGVRWFHSGGLFAALSDAAPDLIAEAMEAARAAGAIVSFDVNFREPLWRARGGEAQAQATIRRIAEHVDVLVGSEQGLRRGLGLAGPEPGRPASADPTAFLDVLVRVVQRHPKIRVVAATLREVQTTNRHGFGAVAWVDGSTHVVSPREIDVLDRVGSGDGFAAGLFYGLMSGATPDDALRLGWAHGALVATFPGDTTMATLEQVRALAKGGAPAIRR